MDTTSASSENRSETDSMDFDLADEGPNDSNFLQKLITGPVGRTRTLVQTQRMLEVKEAYRE